MVREAGEHREPSDSPVPGRQAQSEAVQVRESEGMTAACVPD